MLLNPYRFAPGGAPSAWTTLADSAFTSSSDNWSNYTIRTWLSRSVLPAGATKMRVTFGASSVEGMKISEAYVGPSLGYEFLSSPTQMFFSSNADVTIATDGTALTDEVALPYDGDTDLCISFRIPADTSYNRLANRAAATFFNSRYGSIAANSTSTFGGDAVGSLAGIRKIEVLTGGSWKNIFLSHNAYPSTGWGDYTIRSFYDLDQFTRIRPIVRIGLANRASEMFIGNSAEGASPFDFLATPTRLTFGGNNGTGGSSDLTAYLTDEFDFASLVDPTKPLLVSYYSTSSRLSARTSPPTGQSSRYKSGNSVSDVTWHSGSSSWSSFLGPHLIDEKY